MSAKIRSKTNYRVEGFETLKEMISQILIKEQIISEAQDLENFEKVHPISQVMKIKKGFPPKLINMDDLDQKVNFKEENLIVEIDPSVDGSWSLKQDQISAENTSGYC